jgi:hypothetical protein
MTTASQAHEWFKAKLAAAALADAAGTPLPLQWFGQNDNPVLPDLPAPFLFTVFDASPSAPIEIGGGRGRNRHRCPGSAEVFVFVPRGSGLKAATDIGEAVASLFRPLNDSGVTVDSATVYPGGPGSELSISGLPAVVGDYFYAGAGIEFHFDVTG